MERISFLYKKEPLAGENSYLFRTEDPEKILNWNNGGTTAGEYLKGLLENRLPEDKKEGVTLRQAYYQWYKDSTHAGISPDFAGRRGASGFIV